MKYIFVVILSSALIVACSSLPKEDRTPNQVTGDFGKGASDKMIKRSMYVRLNILQQVVNKNGKVLSSNVVQWSPCPMEYVDLLYTNSQKSGGSCTTNIFNSTSTDPDDAMNSARLGVKVVATHDGQGGFNSELIVGVGDTAYTIVKRVEDMVNLDQPYYQKFAGQPITIETNEQEGNKNLKLYIESVEIANSRYYEAGANFKGFEEVNFAKIAQDYVDANGGIEHLLTQQRTNDLIQESKRLNKLLKMLKSIQKDSPEKYQELKQPYAEAVNDLNLLWDKAIQANPALKSKRIKFIELD